MKALEKINKRSKLSDLLKVQMQKSKKGADDELGNSSVNNRIKIRAGVKLKNEKGILLKNGGEFKPPAPKNQMEEVLRKFLFKKAMDYQRSMQNQNNLLRKRSAQQFNNIILNEIESPRIFDEIAS